MARETAADRRPGAFLVHRLSDAAQPELLVDVRRHPLVHARRADHHRHHTGDALHAACRSRLQIGRSDHARRQLRLAAALPARQRRRDVLPRRLHPHVPRPVLRVVQGAARGALDSRRHPLPIDDGHRLHGLRAGLGSDELLGGDRDHQSVLRHTRRRRRHRHLAVGRLRGRQSDAQSLLLAALPAAVRDRRCGGAARLGAARDGSEQSNRHRAEVGPGHGVVHALCDHQGRLPDGVLLHPICLVRVLHPELPRPFRQLHPGQSGGDAVGNRARMVLPAVLRHPALDPEQAARRDRAVRFDRHSGVPALARYFEGALGALSSAVPAVFLAVRYRGHRARLARHQAAGGHLCHPRAHLHVLVLRLFPDRPAAARHLREDQTAAEFDFGIGSGCQGVRMVMNIRRPIFALVLAGSLAAMAWPASAQLTEQVPPPRLKWSFAGPFGEYDEAQLQRGFKIYREVCANCHSLDMVSFRNLADPGGPGFSEAQAEAVAAEYKVKDIDDLGNPVERAGRLADHFPAPFANELAAKATHGVAPPDMSTLAKARGYQRGFPLFVFDIITQFQEQGPDYIAAYITGYEEPPKGFVLPEGGHYNEYFPGHNTAMPPPLQAGQVTYDDASPQTVEQYSNCL